MPRMKYIRYDAGIADAVVVFPEFIDHGDMACRICPNRDLLVSAGFVRYQFDEDLLECFGKSISLNLESRPEDTKLLNKQLGLNEFTIDPPINQG